jgi:hypothetical protein
VDWILGRWWGRLSAVIAFIDVMCNFWLYPTIIDGGDYSESYIDYRNSESFVIRMIEASFGGDISLINSLISIASIAYIMLAFVGFGFLVLIIRNPLEYALEMEGRNGRL